MAQLRENEQLLSPQNSSDAGAGSKFKDRLKLTLSGFSGAYMLPISTLVLVAVFLSVGGFIESGFDRYSPGQMAGTLVKSLAYPLLQALPLLFCVAFTLSFCRGDTACVWSSVLAYLVFISVQGIFIKSTGTGYVVIFDAPGRRAEQMANMVDRNLGFICLNTSVVGSFFLGGIMMPIVDRWSRRVNLHGPFAFFSGKRSLPLLSVVGAMFLAIYFLILWPWIGFGVSKFGEYFSRLPGGLDSFLFGLVEKCLIPTGLHHMFYAPLWFSPMGGDVVRAVADKSVNITGTMDSLTHHVGTHDRPGDIGGLVSALKRGGELPHSMWQGDSFIGLSAISLPQNQMNNQPVFKYFEETLKIHVGRFTQGKYPIMQFCLPAAALGMAVASGNARQSLKVLGPGIMSSALLGITEPLEFTFLFAAPALFYGFHGVMCGLSFLLMKVLGAHIPSILSGGLIELMIMGIIPAQKGTNWYYYPVVGMALSPLYFFVFYWMIRSGRLRVAGVNEGAEAAVHGGGEEAASEVPAATRKLALALGGWENISKMSNCASRLRYDIVDRSKVDEGALKAAGVIAVKWVGDNHLQAIVGPRAEGINNEMLKWNGKPL